MHTCISGITKLSEDNEQKLGSVSTISYERIQTIEELKIALQNCDVFWFRLNHKITEEIVKNAQCKYILCAATGLDHIDVEACKKVGIHILSLKGESEFLKEVRATAEHTIGLILSLIRRSKRAFQHVENGEWNRYEFQGFELYKKKVGVLGMGRLGKIVAEYYLVMGMEVFYYDIAHEIIDSKFKRANSMIELCSKVDILSIHLPYQKATHNIINGHVLSHLKNTAFIVNTARGGVFDELDLINALKNNEIAGYATEVLFGEPDISKHPLVSYARENENVIITPHIAGNTFESIEKTEAFVLNKLIAKVRN